jgi:hypothetical protein
MVALAMKMHHEFLDALRNERSPKGTIRSKAGFLDGSDKTLGVGIVACHQLQVVR